MATTVSNKKINWTNSLFLTITPIVAIVGTVFLAITHAIHWPVIVLAVVFIFLTGLSITAGYHRLFSHPTYKASWPVRLFFILFGAAAFEGSVLEWCSDHRNHHLYTDTDKDPYNSKRGFWYAHIGWLFHLDTSKRDFSNVEDLQKDPLIRWQHKYYLPISIAMGFLLPTAIVALWGNPLSGLIIAGALRITLNQHFTFCINSVCHFFGDRPYSDQTTARDNWFTALLTYGEGYHNFHHKFPLDYRNGLRFFDFDPTKWLIRALAYVGLANNLKRINVKHIIKYRMRMDEKQINAKAEHCETLKSHIVQIINPARETVMQMLTKLEELEKAYSELKQKKLDFVNVKTQDYKRKLREYRIAVKHVKSDLKHSLSIWTSIVKNCQYLSMVKVTN